MFISMAMYKVATIRHHITAFSQKFSAKAQANFRENPDRKVDTECTASFNYLHAVYGDGGNVEQVIEW
jgi:hypothetical protein